MRSLCSRTILSGIQKPFLPAVCQCLEGRCLFVGQPNGAAEGMPIWRLLAACNEVLKADVALLPNFADLFEFGNKSNEEIIMSIANTIYDGGENYF